MTKYYEHRGITIYHGDCRETIRALGPSLVADLVLTDPPYNASNSAVDFAEKGFSAVDEKWDKDFKIDFVSEAWGALSATGSMLVFCSYHLLRDYLTWQKPRQIVHWHKANPFPAIAKVYTPSTEYVLWWTKGSPYTFNKSFAGVDYITTPICAGNERTEHPTQKPLTLIQQLLTVHAPERGLVLDCFMGSGTTLRAAKDLGLKAIGVEIEEKYCEIAARRLEQEVFDFN